MALELARHGVPSVVLDRKPHLEVAGSRSIVIARHTLETFARHGCGERALAKAVALRRARTYFRDIELFSIDFPEPRRNEIPRFVNLQQRYTEQYLLAQVEQAPLVEQRWDSEVVGLAEDDDGVVLTLRGGGGRRGIRGSYAVGCDGAHSAVRRLAGVPLRGRTFPDRFLIADIHAELPFPSERRFFFDPPSNPGRQILIHPQPDSEWRIDWQVPHATDGERERASGVLDERIRALVGEVPYELVWLTTYRFHERIADRFRVGRVFLAGDAAHLFAPFGARGMNSGIEDTRNLGWKLALVLAGQAPKQLLDTYEQERRRAAEVNLRVTSATMRFMTPPTVLHRAVRNAILRGSVRIRPLRRLVNSGRLAEPADYGNDGGALVGKLAPRADQELSPALGRSFAALVFSRDRRGEERLALALANARLPVSLQLVSVGAEGDGGVPGLVRVRDDEGDLARDYGVGAADVLFVIRPDGYVAARIENPDGIRVERALRSALRLP
jgi:2-polyprenyl-6-methoxyphenol hydroxylase-like FAD-dependent oxidoreductase